MLSDRLSKRDCQKITCLLDETAAGTHHEKIYPWDTVGELLTPGNGAWGNPKLVIPIDGVTDDYGWGGGAVSAYSIVGVKLMLVDIGGKGDSFTLQLFRLPIASAEALDGDANAGQKVIPVGDTSFFKADDIIWIEDTGTPTGEICEIGTIDAGVSVTVKVDLVNAFTVGNSATIYLARRNEDAYRCIWRKFSHANEKDLEFFMFHAPRTMDAGDALLARTYGIENADPTCYITALYDDLHGE